MVTILNNYFETVNETDIPDEITNTSDIELTTLDNKYKINLSKIYKGKFSNNELSDLSKLQNYFRNNTFSELLDNDTFKNNEILTDASTISFTDDYGNAENYYYEVIEYNTHKYILTEEDDTILEVNNFEIKDVSNIKFNYKSEFYVENNSLNFRSNVSCNLKSISNIFEIEEFEISIGDTSIFTMQKGYEGDTNDWTLIGGNGGETQVELTGKTSGKKITINILVN